MRKTLATWCAAGVALFALAGSVARAEFQWSYTVDSFSINNTNDPVGTSSIQFTGGYGNIKDSSGITVSTINTTPPVSGVGDFDKVPISFAIKFTDTKSGKQGTATFNGTFSGKNLTSSSFNAAGAFDISTSSPQKLTLGDSGDQRDYLVSLVSLTPPGAPNDKANNVGSVYAEVVVQNSGGDGGGDDDDDDPPPNDVPEPASLAMAALGASVVAYLRRRRKNS